MTTISGLTVKQQRFVDARLLFLGVEAESLYEAHGRSLRKLTYFARQSSLPGCHRLATGLALALAQALLVEEMTGRSVFDSPATVLDFLKLHIAGQPHESFAVLFPNAPHADRVFSAAFGVGAVIALVAAGTAWIAIRGRTKQP